MVGDPATADSLQARGYAAREPLRLTAETWGGLDLRTLRPGSPAIMAAGSAECVLALYWGQGGAAVEVRTARGRQTYVARSRCLDLIEPGLVELLAIADTEARMPLIAVVPLRATVSALVACGDEPPALAVQSRYQFQNRCLERLLNRLEEHRTQAEPLGDAYTRALSIMVARHVIRSSLKSRSDAHADVVGKRLLENTVLQQMESRMGVADLAALVGMSMSPFLRWFKAVFGVTPHQYIVRCRIEAAKLLLSSPEGCSLTDLALRLGFSSHAHFSNTFRVHAGLAPSAYREQQRWSFNLAS